MPADPLQAQGGSVIGSRPTTCPSFISPNSGITNHAGGSWLITWTTAPYQFGSATYSGTPNPVVSLGRSLTWRNPSADATCTIYTLSFPDGHTEYEFDWHVLSYGGIVSSQTACSTTSPRATRWSSDPSDVGYDPTDPYGDPCSPTSGGSAPSGPGCHSEYIYIDESADGGATWSTVWEGYATVCD